MSLRVASPQPKFGFAAAPSVLRTLDYSTLGATTTAQSKLLYTTCIGSRVVQNRSMRERLETIRRDLLGWYFWFMGNHLIQSLAMMSIIPRIAPHAKKLLVRNMNPEASMLQKVKWFLLNPSKLWLITTDKQLEQRERQVVGHLVKEADRLKSTAAQADLKAAKQVFEQSKNIRGLTSAFGFVFNILLLGYGIMQFNIWMTKSSVQKQQAEQALQAKMKAREKALAPDPEPAPSPQQPVYNPYGAYGLNPWGTAPYGPSVWPAFAARPNPSR